jgi:predicted nucleotidyltransferase
MTGATQELLTRVCAVFRERANVELVLLFGSFARDAATPQSDVDLAVLAPGADPFEIAARCSEATDREVDVVSLEDVEIPLLAELVKDAIVVYEGRAGAAARWRFHALLELETDGPWYRRMAGAFMTRLAAAAPGSDRRG